ncbi:two-component sensor histidine kinase [Spongiactinospora rosea]|uniref:histidine kinase n=1 Tax=Spongiactinospora rosea TaxID=2248750 RepID=A0A366LR06_9ACTN|nr:two-component sensor histidine kinase [Spongiactinospora rosea]
MLACAVAGLLFAPDAGPAAVGSALVACGAAAAVLGAPPVRRRAVPALAMVAPLSAGVSLTTDPPAAGAWAYLETLALLLVLIIVVRDAPVRQALGVGLAGGVAGALLILRVVPASSVLEAVGLCAFWALGPAGAAAIGAHLRWLDSVRVRSVAAARRAQRLRLARDLHDFIAHDLGEMVVQAQVGQVARDREREALRHIEATGRRALTSLSATVRALHDLDAQDERDEPDEPDTPGLGELPRIVAGFAAAGTVPATLALDPDLADRLPRRVSTTVARIVVEALSNVRRHAPDAESVRATVSRDGPNVVTSVVNGPGRGAPPRTPSTRLGLPALEERVRSLGGTFAAGPHLRGGWQVLAEIPVDTLLPDG